jgi:hypothetical protein
MHYSFSCSSPIFCTYFRIFGEISRKIWPDFERWNVPKPHAPLPIIFGIPETPATRRFISPAKRSDALSIPRHCPPPLSRRDASQTPLTASLLRRPASPERTKNNAIGTYTMHKYLCNWTIHDAPAYGQIFMQSNKKFLRNWTNNT